MSEIIESTVLRTEIQVDGATASYLTVKQDAPAVLLLHGTYWSRVWLPVMDRLGAAGSGPSRSTSPDSGAREANSPWRPARSQPLRTGRRASPPR